MSVTFRQKYGWVPFDYLEGYLPVHNSQLNIHTHPSISHSFLTKILQCLIYNYSFASLEYEKFGLGYASDTTSTRLPTLRVRYACPNNSTCWPRFTIFSTVWRRSPSSLGKTRTTSQCILIPPESICYSLGWLSLLWGNSSFR